jgi:RNA polymerase sigma-70 factor (ECF subfamily)
MSRDKTEAKHLKLLKKTSKGDTKAFEELYEMTSRSIYFYLYRLLQNEESAEDVRIDVYTQVWKNAGRFEGRSKVTTWIFGIARNLAFNELRKKKNTAMGELTDTIEDTNSLSGYAKFENSQLIQKAMMELPAKQRDVMDLVFFHELNYKEVAEVLSIPENTVKTRIHHAKKALKSILMLL